MFSFYLQNILHIPIFYCIFVRKVKFSHRYGIWHQKQAVNILKLNGDEKGKIQIGIGYHKAIHGVLESLAWMP